jgi:hypothetical protein
MQMREVGRYPDLIDSPLCPQMVGKLLHNAIVNIKRMEYSNCTFYSSFIFILVKVELNIEWETVPIRLK